MPSLFFLILCLAIACIVGWICGEASNNRSVRVIATIATVIVFSAIAAIGSGISTSLSVGIPMSAAVHEYLDASSAQLAAGHADFVSREFEGFKDRAHVTYETGGFLNNVRSETARMKAGPPSE